MEVVRSEKRLSCFALLFCLFFFALGSPGVWQLHLKAKGRLPKAAKKVSHFPHFLTSPSGEELKREVVSLLDSLKLISRESQSTS